MSFEGDNTTSESMRDDILTKILCELRKITFILSDIHEIEVDEDDVADD